MAPAHRRRLIALILACLTAAAPAAAFAAELTIRVTGLRSGAGAVHYGLYDSPRAFPERRGRIAKGQVPADADGVAIVVSGLAPGTYAVAVYHDENGNDRFDRGLFGLPLEDYGFSNDASGFLGPPAFAAAAFAVKEPKTAITIRLDR